MSRKASTPLSLLVDPVSATDATHKGYVDTQLAKRVPILTPTSQNTTYTASAGDLVLADASGSAFTVTLPTATPGAVLEVKKTDASTNAVTVAAASGNTVGSLGAASFPIRLTDQAAVFQANGTNWIVSSGYQSLSALDGRYAPQASPTFTGTVTVPEPAAATSASSKNYVDTTTVPATQRGPIGGIGSFTLSASTFTLNPAYQQLRYTLNGDITINVPGTAPQDGQPILIEAYANTANRVVTFASGFEVSQAVPGRVFTIPSNTWGYIIVKWRNGTPRLVSAEPQATVTVPSLPAYSAWLPSDHGLLAWTADPIVVNSTYTVGTSGYLVGAALKLDQAATVSNIVYYITAAGATFTSNRNYVGIYNSANALVAQTADQSTNWTSAGIKTTALTSSVTLSAGTYYIAYITTATTRPTFAAALVILPINVGRTTLSYRNFVTGTAYTSLPSTKPAATTFANSIWFGLS